MRKLTLLEVFTALNTLTLLVYLFFPKTPKVVIIVPFLFVALLFVIDSWTDWLCNPDKIDN